MTGLVERIASSGEAVFLTSEDGRRFVAYTSTPPALGAVVSFEPMRFVFNLRGAAAIQRARLIGKPA